MFTQKWCFNIGLVLVLSLMLSMGSAEADISATTFCSDFVAISGSCSIATNGWRIDLSPDYEGVHSFTVPVSGIYYQGLDWLNYGWYDFPDSVLEFEVDGVLVEAVDNTTPVGGSLIAPVGSVVWAPNSIRRRGTVPSEMPLQAGVTHEMRVRVIGGHGAWLYVLYSGLTTPLPDPVADAGDEVVVAPSLVELLQGPVTANLSGSASSGTTPYTYSWSNGATTANTTVDVPFGSSTTYTLTVTDAYGFKDSDTVQVTHSTEGIVVELWDALNACQEELDYCLNPPCPTLAEAISLVGAAADAGCPSGGSYNNHGAYVSCVSHAVETALTTLPDGCFSVTELEDISSAVVSARARSQVGK